MVSFPLLLLSLCLHQLCCCCATAHSVTSSNIYGKNGKIGGDAFDLNKQDIAKLKGEQSNEEEDSEGEAGEDKHILLDSLLLFSL